MVKHKTRLLSIGFFLFTALGCLAQQNTVAAGGNATGAGGSVSYTIGQIDYHYQTGSNGNLNQGVQQPYEIFISGIEDPAIQLGLSVYPNPSTHVLYLNVEKDIHDLSFQLYDINGKQLSAQPIVNNITEIPMEQYSASTYFLKILNSTHELTTFKIIKK